LVQQKHQQFMLTAEETKAQDDLNSMLKRLL
jgi:hypothetical protein